MTTELKPPEVWLQLGQFMHQDFYICHPNFNEGLKEFWLPLSAIDKTDLMVFLDKINSDSLPGGMQKKYWRLSGAQIGTNKPKVFLHELQRVFIEINEQIH
jgi:hypothetical protein